MFCKAFVGFGCKRCKAFVGFGRRLLVGCKLPVPVGWGCMLPVGFGLETFVGFVCMLPVGLGCVRQHHVAATELVVGHGFELGSQ